MRFVGQGVMRSPSGRSSLVSGAWRLSLTTFWVPMVTFMSAVVENVDGPYAVDPGLC